MKTIQAIYENGVFRPIEPVDLPEGSEVTIEPRTAAVGDADLSPSQRRIRELLLQPIDTGDPESAHLEPDLREIYAILAHRYDGGSPDASARHNEHQP